MIISLDDLRGPEISFWTAWEGAELLGCGALKELDNRHGELKSMRTARQHLRQGVARTVLDHMITEAHRRGYARLSLETDSMQAFAPAHVLYMSRGFSYCEPFAQYVPDPYSSFMTKAL